MLARSVLRAATAALLALAVAQSANAWDLDGNGGDAQPSQRSTTSKADPGSAPAAGVPAVTSIPSPAWASTGGPGRAVPAMSTPSSQPTLQQIRR